MTGGGALKALLAQDDILVLPGVADALTARIVENAGFPAVYVTGAGFANASFALPDIGLITLSEVVTHVERIAAAVDVPVVVDADTGYGDVLQVRRTIRQLERAGAAAVQLEDQAEPKRCGHFDGQQLIGATEMVRKIGAALDARDSEDLVLIARTDAMGVNGFDDAVARGRAYVAAGADVVFVEAPRTMAELSALPREIDAPLIANMVEGGKTPLLSAGELGALGYRVALFANTALRASIASVSHAMESLRARGSTAELLPTIASWSERQDLVRLGYYEELENKYIAAADS